MTADPLEDGLVPVIRGRIDGRPAELLLDTGATATILTQAFFAQHRAALSRLSQVPMSFVGVGGRITRESVVAPQVTVAFRRGSVRLPDVRIFTAPSQLDVAGLVGNAGRDLWNTHGSATLDFHRREVRFD